jgi:hypothetical protein
MLGGNDVSLIILILLLLKCSSCSFVKPSKILDPSVQDLSLLSSSEIYSNNGKRLKKYLGMNARYNDSSQIDFSFFKGVNISLISLELNWMILCDKSNSIRFGQFLNKELGSKSPFCAIPCVNLKPSALENVKIVKEELLNAFGCILMSWDDILLIVRLFNDGSFENILLGIILNEIPNKFIFFSRVRHLV